jgi:hypothetical protein
MPRWAQRECHQPPLSLDTPHRRTILPLRVRCSHYEAHMCRRRLTRVSNESGHAVSQRQGDVAAATNAATVQPAGFVHGWG